MKSLKEIVTRIQDRIMDHDRGNGPVVEDNQISIGITTFQNRFEAYFIPLLTRIRDFGIENEIIVVINGEHEQTFNEDYRKRVLEFIAGFPRAYPIFFPRFRGLSKLWNSIIIHASQNYILILNDDIMITKPAFLADIRSAIHKNQGRSFLINRSWSHFVISREEIDDLGYFDERLLGIGEEDGDMTWRYIAQYGRELASFKMKSFVNYAEETVRSYKPVNIKCHSGTKYSLFNREFMFTQKYQADTRGIKGMFDEPVIMKDPGKEQYPHERFYRLHKKDL
jgi:glycosyltransferase involved in cell wall biosynthesis